MSGGKQKIKNTKINENNVLAKGQVLTYLGHKPSSGEQLCNLTLNKFRSLNFVYLQRTTPVYKKQELKPKPEDTKRSKVRN